jgi:ATP-dependent RNA helicase DDX51/DBP6
MADKTKQKKDTKDKSKKRKRDDTDLDLDREEEIHIQEPKADDVNNENNDVKDDDEKPALEESGKRPRPKKRRFEEPIVTSMQDKVVPKWMKTPILISSDQKISLEDLHKTNLLKEQIITNLREMGIDELFPVQMCVIPHIMTANVVGGDICVSAPTGSGKTLAYAIPIVNALMTRSIVRVRCVVLVPTRDLVVQVKEVFRQLIKGTGLKLQAIYGEKSFKEEQFSLVGEADKFPANLRGGVSNVDIIVATPGRLMDHVNGTPGFTLQHVNYLVIDEADRLLMQSYQDWLPNMFKAIHNTEHGQFLALHNKEGGDNKEFVSDPCTTRSINAVRQETLQFPQLQKLLFSATLTQNPRKIASLKLVNPKYFTATTEFIYKIPSTLTQQMVVCRNEVKPVVLAYLINKLKLSQTLCFTSSLEATHRLTLLLRALIVEHAVQFHFAEYSSNLAQHERERMLKQFKDGSINLIICSDIMSRGLDLDDVTTVINYDIPKHIKTYIHRVGRTARAGRSGQCFTILRKEEVRFFKTILRKAENSRQKEFDIEWDQVNQLMPQYDEALKQLKFDLEREQGAIKQTSTDVLRGHTKIKSSNPQDVNYIRSAIAGQLQANLFGAALADKLEDDADLSIEDEQEEKPEESKHNKKHDKKEKKDKSRRDKDAMEE